MTLLADGYWAGHMMGWWWMLLVVVPLVLLLGSGLYLTWVRAPRAESPLAILERRYAKGEIEREEFLARKRDLEA